MKLLNKIKFNSKGLIIVLFGYIIAQFLWWEVLLVRQNNQLIYERQKLLEVSISDEVSLRNEIVFLHEKKFQKTLMIVGEGTIFLLLLLYGINLIRKANKRENDLLNQKNNFLLSITHELKTPLATTKLQLQTLKKHQLSPEKQQELIATAIQENERLNVLIDNVLLATRMQQNEYVLSKENVNLSDFATGVITTTYSRELDAGILKLDVQSNVTCHIDKIAFPSIITNLIDNAFKYSTEELLVSFELKKNQDQIIIRVSDRGIGVKDEEKQQIFEQFYRSGNEEIRRTKGTGLGLFIVKYLVNQHAGEINIKDNKPKGSVFEVKFKATDLPVK
jgi:two-component system sensor histidine kinase CiaH